jgi:adenylate cyclase
VERAATDAGAAPAPDADPAVGAGTAAVEAATGAVAAARSEASAALAAVDGPRMVKRIRRRLSLSIVLANVIGAGVVLTFIVWVLPGDPIADATRLVVVNAILGGVYLLLFIPVGSLWGEAWIRGARRWIQEGREPTDKEVTAVLRIPLRLFFVHLTLWVVAAALFSVLNALVDVSLLARVAFTIVLGGLTTSGFVYLVAERITRPLATAALSIRAVGQPRLPGITARTMLGWTLGTGVPLLGLVITAIFSLVDPKVTTTQIAVTMLALSGTGLVVGWWVAVLGARAVAEPVRDLRKGIAQVAAGDLDTRVEVYDGSVLGLLQAGFNDMAAGLREREQLRDLYGKQVGEDVARGALERGAALGGELRDVAVLFVDVVGSTTLASTRPAEEVVGLLNRFFGVVVDEVHANGGWVNKFQGDATLVVFGAPTEVDDPAGRALATARALARRLPAEVPELGAGIGVAYGPAVAGNVGDERRFEFTVIGDPVNEASRLTELAKQHDPMVLASSSALDAAGPDEAACWRLDGTADLRGRTQPTRLARPLPT